MKIKVSGVVAFGLGVMILAGCAADRVGDEFEDEKTATTAAALDEGTSASELEGLASADPAKAAESLAAKSDGCRTRTVDAANPAVVHVKLEGCTRRFGRHVVSGELTVTFSANADGSLHSETTSNDLTIDGRPFTRKVSADIRLDGDLRHVSRHSEETGSRKNGDSLVRTGDHVIVFDKAKRCRTMNGTGHAVVGGDRTISSTITSFVTCEAADGQDYCPTGTIEHVNESKRKTVLKTFDGSATARIDISKPKGDKTTTWSLDCTPR